MGPQTDSGPVLAHVLFMDIVGCSKLPSDQQKRIVSRLQELVSQSAEFQRSRQSEELISLPTGDGMALAFFDKLDAAVRCAIEVAQSIQAESLCTVRMGVHTGPVFVMDDINGKRNISGAGINRAERVMSCGDEGHILLSDNVAESLRNLSEWHDKIHEVGECKAKDGWMRVWSLIADSIGNSDLPHKSKRHFRRKRMLLLLAGLALVLSIAAAITGAFWLGRGSSGRESFDKSSIAVLPFADLSAEKNQEYFSDGLAEELLEGLARTPGLRVAGRTSSFQFKRSSADVHLIGAKLNVGTVLEGSVRKQGNRMRIAVALLKTADGFQLWSETFDRQTDDVFAVQEEIARAVTGALKLELLGRNTERSPHSTQGDAYNAYLQGRYFYGRHNQETLAMAVHYFGEAIRLDSRYAPAWVGLAEALSDQAGAAYIPVQEGYQKAREAIDRALALDPNLGEAHAALGWIKMFRDWDWSGADAAYRRALTLEPGNPRILRGAGYLARLLGRLQEAIAFYRRATEIDPLDSNAYGSYGIALHYAGQQEAALAALGKALDLAPEMAIAHALVGQVHLARSDAQKALTEADKEKDPVFRLRGLALAYHVLGRAKQSDASLSDLIRQFQGDSPYQIAEVFAFRNQRDEAMDWLRRSYRLRDPGLNEMRADPLLHNVRQDPRFRDLLKQINLPLM